MIKMANAKNYTRRYDYALQMLGKTGNQHYNKKMDDIEKEAKKVGLVGDWSRNSRGNNKMFRFK